MADDLDELGAYSRISRQRLEYRLEAARTGREAFLVYELDGRPVGMLSVRWHGGCDGPRPWFYGAQVRPELRGRGIGTALWLAGEKLCADRTAREVALDVDRDNEQAIRLYSRLGYAVIRPHEHHWQNVDKSTGEVTSSGVAQTWIMRKELG